MRSRHGEHGRDKGHGFTASGTISSASIAAVQNAFTNGFTPHRFIQQWRTPWPLGSRGKIKVWLTKEQRKRNDDCGFNGVSYARTMQKVERRSAMHTALVREGAVCTNIAPTVRKSGTN
jgi:hypothetical protein